MKNLLSTLTGAERAKLVVEAAGKISVGQRAVDDNYIVIMEQMGGLKLDGSWASYHPKAGRGRKRFKNFAQFCVQMSRETGFEPTYFAGAAREWLALTYALKTIPKAKKFYADLADSAPAGGAHTALGRLLPYRFNPARALVLIRKYGHDYVEFKNHLDAEFLSSNPDMRQAQEAKTETKFRRYDANVTLRLVTSKDKGVFVSTVERQAKRLGIKFRGIYKLTPKQLGKIVCAAMRKSGKS